MPSNRKKNKRRMRKVQAQRKALEERFVSSGKGTPGVCAVPAPVPAQVPVSKISECPIAVPIPLAVIAPIDVPAEVTPAEPVMVQAPVTDAIKDEVVKAAEDLRQTPVEPSAKELVLTEDGDSIAIPVLEVISSIDEPVSNPAESEVQFEDTTPVATEMHVVAQPVETVDTECEGEGELPAEDPVVDVPVPEEMVTTAETVAAVETVTEKVVIEVEPVADAAVEVVGVVGEPDVEAEAITVENEPAEVHKVAEVTEDVHAETEPEEFPVEAAVPTEALVEPEPEQQQQSVLLEEPTPSVESTSDPITEEFVVTEKVAADTTAAEEQIPETATDASEVQSETLSETIPAPEPLPVPVAKEIIQDLAVAGGLTVDAINGCLGATEVAIEG
ncbi:calphotin-like isoform X2 [Sinocyclocheilus anshuiensis]|uniref:calphotin-like isoform X2 n=1 Tax=Sinocyclocheilus anshuiensis TaxID=1608454 RepID=UPI0007B811B5|nr:PREDICTED: calphotin-like isoform X2 [Sinocyclocheilus anshuiensis]